ncbi:hypothetical protein LSO2F_420001 [Candidatus Liberibacter solanacearum]
MINGLDHGDPMDCIISLFHHGQFSLQIIIQKIQLNQWFTYK